MNYISFMLGMISGIVLVLAPSYAVGLYLRRHPEIIVRRMTRTLFHAQKDIVNAPDHLHR